MEAPDDDLMPLTPRTAEPTSLFSKSYKSLKKKCFKRFLLRSPITSLALFASLAG